MRRLPWKMFIFILDGIFVGFEPLGLSVSKKLAKIMKRKKKTHQEKITKVQQFALNTAIALSFRNCDKCPFKMFSDSH